MRQAEHITFLMSLTKFVETVCYYVSPPKLTTFKAGDGRSASEEDGGVGGGDGGSVHLGGSHCPQHQTPWWFSFPATPDTLVFLIARNNRTRGYFHSPQHQTPWWFSFPTTTKSTVDFHSTSNPISIDLDSFFYE
ncbi:hypothetical protein Btru_049086 [Bulinus truncatus]|nr:hypothetical protein Btru_049086 [Bulinus truncatus]